MNITLPELGTKAIADGQKVNNVHCIVFRNDRLISHTDVTKTIIHAHPTLTEVLQSAAHS